MNTEEFLEISETHRGWIDAYPAMSGWCAPETLYATAALTFKVLTSGIAGNLCECGVAAGAHPGVMHYCMRFTGQFRKIFLFDSFEGIPMATQEDIPSEQYEGDDIRKAGVGLAAAGEPLRSSGITCIPIEETKRRMERWGAVSSDLVYVKGWFQNTVPVTDTGPLAILRLDGDLYGSTKVCLEHLYPKLVPGGFCILDDWHLAGERRAVREYFNDYDEDESTLPEVVEIPPIRGNPCPVFWRKPIR